MTTASVPSTLVKCLYLFFDLIPTEGDTEGEGEAGAGADRDPGTEAEFTPRERRILLQKMFMQVNILPLKSFLKLNTSYFQNEH